jgi:hypothetical protein
MHVEFLVEEPSVKAALENLVPRMIGSTATFRIHSHRGKTDLLGNLGRRLRGYRSWLPADWRIVVLVDVDQDDCHGLKDRLTQAAHDADLIPKTAASVSRFQVLNRLAIEELEAWFFGDIAAINTAFPRVPLALSGKARYRLPDEIRGGTWEALEREFKRVGYFKTGLSPILAAREISKHMDPARNTSRSFQAFRDGLRALCPPPT